jgi:hypothetical protein
VAYQTRVGSNLEVTEASLLLGSFEPLLDVPPGESDEEQVLDSCACGGVADEVLDFTSGDLFGNDQPVFAIGGYWGLGVRRIDHVNTGSFDFPNAITAGNVFDLDPLPPLFYEDRAEPTHIIYLL